jgi:predicted transcriptional regulator
MPLSKKASLRCWPIAEDTTMQAQTVKEKITEVVLSQPEDASYDEIMRELAFERMVDRGLEDVRAGRLISNDEMAGRIRAWRK